MHPTFACNLKACTPTTATIPLCHTCLAVLFKTDALGYASTSTVSTGCLTTGKSYCGIRLHWQTRTVCPIHLAHESANAGRRPLSKAVSVPAALLASTAAAITVATDPEHLLRSWLAITCNSEQPTLGTPSELQYTQSRKSSYHKHITILACLAIFGGRENGMASNIGCSL